MSFIILLRMTTAGTGHINKYGTHVDRCYLLKVDTFIYIVPHRNSRYTIRYQIETVETFIDTVPLRNSRYTIRYQIETVETFIDTVPLRNSRYTIIYQTETVETFIDTVPLIPQYTHSKIPHRSSILYKLIDTTSEQKI